MTTFTINEQNEIVAFATAEEASTSAQTPFHTFSSQQELADLAASWPTERLLAILNSLAGEKPVKKLKDPKAAVARIWARIQGLDDAARPEPAAKTKPAKKAKGGAQVAKGAPAKGKASKKTSAAKNAPKGKKSAKAAEAGVPREGSKTAQVVAMLQRKNGATITEIMETMSWQRHTVRGFMAGAMKKAGYAVESFKPEGGERSYRLPK
ncbi:MAG TPA: DUF3489 domain-containing protein [Bryobacteraceae bacterium]|nr:DUF3489 domain-containing protein [Bryobacteraceae bacterium]